MDARLAAALECHGGANQLWEHTGGQLRVYGNKCLDVRDGNTANGASVQIWDCAANNTNQQWTRRGQTWEWAGRGKCLDMDGGIPQPGARVYLWDCIGGEVNQAWYHGQAVAGAVPTPAPQPAPSGGGSSNAALPNPGDGTATIQFENRCGFAVQVGGTAPSNGSVSTPPFATVASRSAYNLNLGPDSGRYPGLAYYGVREGTTPGYSNMTLAEFSINDTFQNMDFYDVSLVDAFNLPMQITPVGGNACPAPACAPDLLATCPAEGRVMQNGQVVSCSKHGPGNQSVDLPNTSIAQHFKAACGDVYTWSGDDAVGTKGCVASQDFRVTFCP